MHRSLPLAALLLAGCAASTPPLASVPPSQVEAKPSAAPKVVEAVPPTNIGDGSPIVFTHWKGMRKGSGTLVRAGKTTKVRSFDLELNPDGTMLLALDGRSEDAFKGTWRRQDGKTVALRVPGGPEGTLLFMDRANPYRLSLKGKDAALEFRASE